jgi:hypothetical protein
MHSRGEITSADLLWREGMPEWKNALETLSIPTASLSLTAPPTVPSFSASAEPQIPIADTLTKAYALVTRHWPLIIGAFLLYIILEIIIGLPTQAGVQILKIKSAISFSNLFFMGGSALIILGFLINTLLQFVLMAGMYHLILRVKRGQPSTVTDLFHGFQHQTLQLILLSVVSTLFISIGLGLCLLPGIYLIVSYWFAPILIIDRNLSFWDAMETSRKMANRCWFPLFGFLLVLILITLGGLLACCVGILFAGPLTLAATVYLYEELFPH